MAMFDTTPADPGSIAATQVTGHPFVAPPGEPWERCVALDEFERPCGLARSAHVAELAPYAPDTPRASGGE